MNSNKSILLVEDDPFLLQYYQAKFTKLGLKVFATTSGVEALNQQEGYDCVIQDIGLPDKDGFDLLTEMRTKYPKTPILVLTKLQSEQDQNQAMSLGATEFICKFKVNLDYVTDRVLYYLGQSSS